VVLVVLSAWSVFIVRDIKHGGKVICSRLDSEIVLFGLCFESEYLAYF
jgi:hypothetical protein